MDLRKHVTLTRLLTVMLSIIAPMTRVVAQNLGKVGAVNQDATGTPPGESAHTLVVGAGVVYKEAIKTSAQGSTQILFPDQSTLNVARNSSIVIDEYVYDPKAGTGTMLNSRSSCLLKSIPYRRDGSLLGAISIGRNPTLVLFRKPVDTRLCTR